MIKPLLQDDAFLADVERVRPQSAALHIWWLGQSGFLMQAQDRHLLFDPYLSDALSEGETGPDKRHARMTDLVIAPDRLDMLDVIAISHEHPDHFDPATLKPLLAANPNAQVLLPAPILAQSAAALGVDEARLTGMEDGKTIVASGFHITPIAAAHEELTTDDAGRHLFLGYVVELRNDMHRWTVYHSGDTLRYPGLAERLRPLRIDVALLPINGRIPDPNVDGNLSGAEAAQLAHDGKVELVVPCHYEVFRFNTATPDDFINACNRLGQQYTILQSGERLTLNP